MVTALALALAFVSPAEGEAVSAALAAAVEGPCVEALTLTHLKRENPAELSNEGKAFFARHGLTVATDDMRKAFFDRSYDGVRTNWPVVGSRAYGEVEVHVAIDREGQCAVAVADDGALPAITVVEAAMLETGWKKTVSFTEGSAPPQGINLSRRIGERDWALVGSKRLTYPNSQFRITLGLNQLSH